MAPQGQHFCLCWACLWLHRGCIGMPSEVPAARDARARNSLHQWWYLAAQDLYLAAQKLQKGKIEVSLAAHGAAFGCAGAAFGCTRAVCRWIGAAFGCTAGVVIWLHWAARAQRARWPNRPNGPKGPKGPGEPCRALRKPCGRQPLRAQGANEPKDVQSV